MHSVLTRHKPAAGILKSSFSWSFFATLLFISIRVLLFHFQFCSSDLTGLLRSAIILTVSVQWLCAMFPYMFQSPTSFFMSEKRVKMNNAKVIWHASLRQHSKCVQEVLLNNLQSYQLCPLCSIRTWPTAIISITWLSLMSMCLLLAKCLPDAPLATSIAQLFIWGTHVVYWFIPSSFRAFPTRPQ